MSVNIGAFWFLDYNEDKLAAVIAHELVHGQKEHPIKGNKVIQPDGISDIQIYEITEKYNSFVRFAADTFLYR